MTYVSEQCVLKLTKRRYTYGFFTNQRSRCSHTVMFFHNGGEVFIILFSAEHGSTDQLHADDDKFIDKRNINFPRYNLKKINENA